MTLNPVAESYPTSTPEAQARTAHAQQRVLAAAPAADRTRALENLTQTLVARQAEILRANEQDLQAAKNSGLEGPALSRLQLSPAKLEVLREGVLTLTRSADPVSRVLTRTELDEGLVLDKVASPIGTILVIFESRPDAVIQIGSLAIRSGNAVLLKGGAEATLSNQVLVECLRDSLSASDLPADCVVGVNDRASVETLLRFDSLIDLVIPRGSGQLVRAIKESTRIPVLGHAEGVCSVYVDEFADPKIAAQVLFDGKCNYPAACNATETLLVHQAMVPSLPSIVSPLVDAGVQLRADEMARCVLPFATPASELDGATEYGDLILAVRIVSSIDEAIDYIRHNGSSHTDCIVTTDERLAAKFLREVDSSSVFHNVSTRFADGYRYGLGAEVGISTSRIHARGPVGIDGLLSHRWLLRGSGQCAGDYGVGKRSFTHRLIQT